MDTTPPIELNRIPLLPVRYLRRRCPSGEDSTAVEILEAIVERAVDIVESGNNPFDTPNSVESLPVMYVVERSPANDTRDDPSPTTPFSPKINDSSDEFFFYNYEMMSGNERQNENLLDEMAKVNNTIPISSVFLQFLLLGYGLRNRRRKRMRRIAR